MTSRKSSTTKTTNKTKSNTQQSAASKTGLEMLDIQPLTNAQKDVFHFFEKNYHLILHGFPGTGKTFLALYLGLKSVFDKSTPIEKIIIVRSCVPTRDVGFLPGNLNEKGAVYELPYKQICSELFERGDAYDILKGKHIIEFISTSFVRGLTFTNALVLVDEMQNLCFEEISTIVTRMGNNSRLVLSGDIAQCDFGVGGKKKETSGFVDLMKIARKMNSFKDIEFFQEDIVRSDFVAEWIRIQESMKLS